MHCSFHCFPVIMNLLLKTGESYLMCYNSYLAHGAQSWSISINNNVLLVHFE
jgi:hypothetical protein